MTDQRIEGAADQIEGTARNGLSRLTGDDQLRLEGRVKEYRGRARDAYGRVIDGLDSLVGRAPAQFQEPARKGLDFARRKPLLTTGLLAGVAILLGGLGRR